MLTALSYCYFKVNNFTLFTKPTSLGAEVSPLNKSLKFICHHVALNLNLKNSSYLRKTNSTPMLSNLIYINNPNVTSRMTFDKYR